MTNRQYFLFVFFFFSLGASNLANATELLIRPYDDLQGIRSFFLKRFPKLAYFDYIHGSYMLDDRAKMEWQRLTEFPPYEFALERGREYFFTPFRNGNHYADCFPNQGIAIRQNYPYFDTKSGQIITLEWAINLCRVENGEPALPYGKGELAKVSAYMAYTATDKPISIKIPDDPRARAAYQAGKIFFYSRRGRMNMACASCHIHYAGKKMRATTISPALGQTTHFPTFRVKWQEIGTLQRRYINCQRDIGAKPFVLQGLEYRQLEYFHTYMSNGLIINAPGIRQ